jgi:hypothetical protein
MSEKNYVVRVDGGYITRGRDANFLIGEPKQSKATRFERGQAEDVALRCGGRIVRLTQKGNE